MGRIFPIFFLVSTCVFSQRNPSMTAPKPGSELVENTPETVVALINGRQFTVGDLQKLLPSLSPKLQQLVVTQPKQALEQYAYGETLAKEADKIKLGEREPYRQQIENARREVLVQALIKEKTAQVPVS